jgi:hypothetical protein
VRPLDEVTIHEQDLRGALEAPALLRQRFADRVAGAVTDGGPPAIR